MTALPLVSVLVIGYRRPTHLRRTVESFLSVSRYRRVELVLADDASPPEEQEEMKRLPFDKFVFSPTNAGLGANTNAGLAATSGEYVLQLQDDWQCEGPHDFIERAIELMLSRPDIGFVRLTDKETMVPEQEGHRFYSRWEAPGGRMVRVFHTPPPRRDYFVYTDTPHLKTRELVQALGPYLVSPYMQRTELDMRDRFNAQTRFKAARFEGMNVFTHIGQDQSFNSLLPMARIGAAMDRIPGVRNVAALYRGLRRRTRR